MSNTRKLTIEFEEIGSQKIIAAYKQMNTQQERLNKILQQGIAVQKLANTEVDLSTKRLSTHHDMLSKHNKLMASAVKLWIGWNIANMAWNATMGKAIGFMASSIKYAGDMNEAYNQVKVTFGSMTKEVERWAASSSASILQTTIATETQLTQIQMLLQGVGIAREKALGMSKTMVERAMDISSFRNVTPEEAFEGVRRALLNQPRLLRGMGVPITGVIGQADIQTKTLEMYNRILEKTAIDMGDVVRTADQWQNIMRALNSEWQDFKRSVGDTFVQNKALTDQLMILGSNMTFINQQIRDGVGFWADWGNAAAGAIGWLNDKLARFSMNQAEVEWRSTVRATGDEMLNTYGGRNSFGGVAMTPQEYEVYKAARGPIFALEPAYNAWLSAKIQGDYSKMGNVGPKMPPRDYPGMNTLQQPPGGGGGGADKARIERNRKFYQGLRAALGGGSKKNQGGGAMLGWLGNLYGGDFGAMQPFDLSGGATATSFAGIPGQMRGWDLGMYRGSPIGTFGLASAINEFFQFRPESTIPGMLGIRGLAHNAVNYDPMLVNEFMGVLRPLSGYKPTGMQRLNKAFGAGTMWDLGAQAAGGDFGGALGSAADIAGTALGWGPIGSIAKALFGSGGLFGKKKKDVGLTPANPIYTRDVATYEVLTQLLNITKGQLIAGTSAGINRQTAQLRLQSMRAT